MPLKRETIKKLNEDRQNEVSSQPTNDEVAGTVEIPNQETPTSELRTEYLENVERSIKDVLENATKSKSKSVTRASGKAGVMSVVNADTGIRITFPDAVLEKIRVTEKLQISYNTDERIIAIGENLGNENDYAIKKSGKKGIIYSANLVRELTEAFKLDFSNRSSITFHDAEYLNDEESSIAVVKVDAE